MRHDARMTAPDLLGGITRTPRPPASNALVAVTAAAALAVAGAGVATAAVLGSGGAQPEDVLPRSTVAVVKVDLDPAADQKVAAYRISRKFPSLKANEDSPLSDLLKQGLESSDSVDYAKDVEPWLGKRLAVAAVPDGKEVTVVIAVQVTDRDKAEAGLKKLAADSDHPFGYALVPGEDYALLTPEGQDAKQYATAGEHLADNEKYGDAVDELDGNQVVTGWVDLAAASALAPQVKGERPSGYVVAGLHLDASYVEVTGKAIDVKAGEQSTAGRGKVGLVQTLPDDTVAAFGMTGLDDGLRTMLQQKDGALGEALSGVEGQVGISLSDDLPAAVGKETAVAVLPGDSPGFGMRSRTDDAERGLAALQRVLAQTFLSGSPDAIARAQGLVRRTPDGLVAGSDPDAVDRIARDGGLGRSGAFRQAVPDAGDAGAIAFVDIQRAIVLSGQDLDEQEVRNTEHLSAVGMSASADGANGSFRLRLTFR